MKIIEKTKRSFEKPELLVSGIQITVVGYKERTVYEIDALPGKEFATFAEAAAVMNYLNGGAETECVRAALDKQTVGNPDGKRGKLPPLIYLTAG